MKTTRYKLFALMLVLGTVSGCKKYLEDAQVNPNAPENASARALLANAELSTFTNFNGNTNRRAAIFTQHMMGVDGQAISDANYLINEGDVVNEWRTLYSNAIISCQTIIDKYGNESPYYSGVAKILKALNLGLATDCWGDVPCRDASKGQQGNLTPKYDPQQQIIQDIQSMLSEAVNELKLPNSANVNVPSADDYIFHGDPESWIGTAYVLKARFANRLSKKNATQSATDALQFLDSAYAHGFLSNANDANAVFGTKGNENNQWAVYEGARGYLRMGKFFIDLMQTNADPRLPFFAGQDANGGYTGADIDPQNATGDESSLGPFYGSITSKAPIVTYVEAKFIEAECQLRMSNPGGAALAHNDAVKASILNVTGAPDPTYEAAHAAETAGSITLDLIMTEKYVALFTQCETWSDWRRTNIPVLTPNPSGVVNGIPRILPTSQEERNYNPNAIIVGNVLQKVWWDQ